MRIFTTAGGDFISAAVIEELTSARHEVTALLRQPSAANLVKRLGATPLPGDLTNPDGYRAAAARHDVIILISNGYVDPAAVEKTAITTLLQVAKLTAKVKMVIYTSGTDVLAGSEAKPADEDASTEHPAPNVTWRPGYEQMILDAADDALTTAVIRPGMVYGGSGGLTAKLFKSAKTAGPAILIGDGENFWSLVHREDLARLYRLVVEKRAQGIFHAVDGRPIKAKEVTKKASEAAGGAGKVENMPVEEARKKLGNLADALCMNQVVVARRSRDLGWAPEHISFIDSAGLAYQEWQESLRDRGEI